MQTLFERFKDFLKTSPTAFHTTSTTKRMLKERGFIELFEDEAWVLKPKYRYFVIRNDASIIAFNYLEADSLLKGFHMVGTHTDSPALKIKPNANLKKAGVNQLAVEVYGGALLNPWFDRDLSIAGYVSFKTKQNEVKNKLIDFKRPLAIIPSLAIHLDREVNKKCSIDAQKDLSAIISLEEDQSFDDLLKKEISDTLDEILSFDLFLYDTQEANLVGVNNTFITAARLDNLLSCFAALESFINTDATLPSLIIFSDHEEIGSVSAHGVESNFLEIVLKRIANGVEDYARILNKSIMISADNAHAVHPNFSDIHDSNHSPIIAKGVVVKYNANQSYATSSKSSAIFQKYADKANKNIQSFVSKNDVRCGSSIGSMMAAKLGVNIVDVGVPSWGMHSIRETAALKDMDDFIEILCSFFNRD